MPTLYTAVGDQQGVAKKKMLAGGMTAIKFPDAEAKEYRDLAYSSFASGMKKQVPADIYDKVIQITTPKK
jgi:hypothetical protein